MSDGKILLHEIFHPAEGEQVNVRKPMTMPGMPPDPNQPGVLCGPCNGKVTKSGYLYGIYVRCQKGIWQDTNSANPNYFPNQDVTGCSESLRLYIPVGQMINEYSWNTAGFGDVAAWGNTTAVDNTIKAVARFFPMDGNPEDSKLNHFKGIWVDSCPTKVATAAAPAIPSETMFHPTQSDGAWLLYEGLPVSAIGIGNLLSRHGVSLRANVLAISAARVHWWSKLSNSTVVRRPAGELVPTSLASPFQGMSRNAIIIHQLQHRHVLVSECRDNPDLIHLDREQNFRIHVNFESPAFPTAGLLEGSYDLWVKVID